jgi:PTS system nitrogen regulatory IIA component
LTDTLVSLLYREGRLVLPALKVREELTRREELRGTVLPSGLAIPHARIQGFDDLLIAVGIPDAPIPTEEGNIRMMVLFLTSPSGSPLYLNSLSAFVKLSEDTAFFGRLCAASPLEFLRILRERKIEVTKVITLASIMNAEAVSLRPENSIRDAIETFFGNRLGYVPVAGQDGKLLGELSVLDLFARGVPDYAAQMGNISFMRDFLPFKELLEQENQIKVAQIMREAEVVLEEDATVMEAVMKFTQKKRHHVPVVKDGKLSGVVSYTDILQKVLRA